MEKLNVHLKMTYSARFSGSSTPMELLNRIYGMQLESITMTFALYWGYFAFCSKCSMRKEILQ